MALTVVTRSGWGARYGRRGRAGLASVYYEFGHHFYSPDVIWLRPGESRVSQLADERAAMRAVEHYHAVNLGWSAAPGYCWVIGDTGTVYEGVGWGRRGVHTQNYNARSIAFCWMINGQRRRPTPEAIAAAIELRE